MNFSPRENELLPPGKMNYFPQGTDTQCIVNSYVSKECERNRDTKKVMGNFNCISLVYIGLT